MGWTLVRGDLGRHNDPHPLGNIIEFHGLSPNPNDLDLTWHEQRVVRPPCVRLFYQPRCRFNSVYALLNSFIFSSAILWNSGAR